MSGGLAGSNEGGVTGPPTGAERRPVLGVMGGLGPAATADFYAKLVAATPAARDQDHIHVIIDSDPTVPNRNDAIAGTGPSAGPKLVAMAKRLEAAGAQALFMVCNTAHAYTSSIRAAVGVPLVSIVEETVAATISRADPATVGVLAAAGAQQARLYPQAFAKRGVAVVEPDGNQLDEFMMALYRIKCGDTGPSVRRAMLNIALAQIEAGATAIVAGCTEVPLVLAQTELPPGIPLVSSTDTLVATAVAIGTGLRPLPSA